MPIVTPDEVSLPNDDENADIGAGFALERHLHEFLVDNWDSTDVGREWQMLEEDGEIVGVYYNTGEVGEIDILAKHRREPS